MANDSQSLLELDVQFAMAGAGSASRQGIPTSHEFHRWAEAALTDIDHAVEMVIRVVDERESRELNGRYRAQDKPTNVLSFPFTLPAGVDSSHLGDLVICAPVVKREAREQQKREVDHWAHMVVHGVLHLRGMDHQTEAQAHAMETLEKQVLARLPFSRPFYDEDQFTDRSERFLAAEMIREQLTLRLHQELPYALTVEIEEFREEAGLIRIGAIVWVERAGQKQIVIGKGGDVLKHVGSRARRELEELFEKKVFLRLWVKVSRDWSDNERALRQFGYDE